MRPLSNSTGIYLLLPIHMIILIPRRLSPLITNLSRPLHRHTQYPSKSRHPKTLRISLRIQHHHSANRFLSRIPWPRSDRFLNLYSFNIDKSAFRKKLLDEMHLWWWATDLG
jgi:hypothetical protein